MEFTLMQVLAIIFTTGGIGLILGSTLRKCDDPKATNTPLIVGIASLILGVVSFAYLMYTPRPSLNNYKRNNYNVETY